jgi:hypothetical protein
MTERNGSLFNGWGRVADYMFGRNTLIGLASLMLLLISGYATWSGMSDFIIGASTSTATQSREIPGGLSVSNHFLVIAIVVALTFLMWLALRETFGAHRRFSERMVTLPLYLFLVLWSIGFGYGFWWSLIAGEEATRSSLSGLQEDARDAGAIVAARLDAVRIQLDNVVSWSETQMAREEASGGSCGKASGAGRGPLYNARLSVRDSVASLRDNITKSWVGPIQKDLELLRRSAARLEGGTFAERQRRFESQATEIRSKARSIAARSNEMGRSLASEMRALSQAVSTAPGEASFSCYDPTLAQRLRNAADQSAEPAVLNLREASFNEGPAGVANAVKNLWSNIGKFITSLGGLLSSSDKDDKNSLPLTGRDLIALLATLGIDLGLFALMVLNPPVAAPPRYDALSDAHARLHLPTETVVRHISDAVRTVIDRAESASFEWVRMHFIHHKHASYFIIPNLYSVDSDNEEEAQKAIAMNQLAGVLTDLDLVRWPKPGELEDLKAEETKISTTDLTAIRKQHVKEFGVNAKNPERYADRNAIRNHGLFSKAERMLEIAKWSEWARNDIEIYKLVDTEGLTPLLLVLNNETLRDEQHSENEHKIEVIIPEALSPDEVTALKTTTTQITNDQSKTEA